MVPYRGGSSGRGGRGNVGQTHAVKNFQYEDRAPYEEVMRDHDEQGSSFYCNNLENSYTNFQRP